MVSQASSSASDKVSHTKVGVPAGVSTRVQSRGPVSRVAPEALHPALWLGHQLAQHADQALPSGFYALDAQLPGGGWPRRVLTELLMAHPGVGEIRLLSHCLASVQRQGRLVMLFDPPATLSTRALAHWGLEPDQLLVINTRTRITPGSDTQWALEQALKSGHVGALLAWLPARLRAERIRRLQLAAQSHDGPAFVLRESAAQHHPTAAPLRLLLQPGGADVLAVRILKRRGPTLEVPLRLALPSVLPRVAQRRSAAAECSAAALQAKALPMTQPAALTATRTAAAEPQALRQATFVNLAS